MLPVEIIRLRDFFLNLRFDFEDIFLSERLGCWLILLLEHSDVIHALKPRSLLTGHKHNRLAVVFVISLLNPLALSLAVLPLLALEGA